MESISLCDFNDLYVISVGLSMTYVYLESTETNKYFFLKFLEGVVESLKELAVKWRFRKRKNEEGILTKADYFIASGKLSNETAGGLKLIREKAKEVICKLEDHEKWIADKLNYHTTTQFLEVISLDAFFYALILLYVGAFENKEHFDVTPLMFVLNIAMFVFVVHCIIADHFDKVRDNDYFKPRKIVHFILLICAVWGGLELDSANWMIQARPYLINLSPVFCFIGFVGYLFIALCVLIIVMLAYYVKVFMIKDKSKEHLEDINRYRNELEQVETTFNAGAITLNVEPKNE